MGNYTSCLTVGSNKEIIQLLHSDGTVQILHKPLSANQIVQEFPEHLVCHSYSFFIGQKTPVLSPNEQLKMGNNYFLLPHHFFHSPLTLLSLASIISPQPPQKGSPNNSTAGLSAPLRSIERASLLCQPFEIQKSDVGGRVRIRVCPQFISKLLEDGKVNADKLGSSVGEESTEDEPYRLCNTPHLQKEYASLVNCRDQRWRPKLETIKEYKKTIGHKIFIKIRRS